MLAGRLRHKIVFERQEEITDDYGNVKGDWEELLTVWGNLRETTGRERLAAGAIESTRPATLRIRVSTASRFITEADRFVARGSVWNIRSIAFSESSDTFYDILAETGGEQ